MPIATLTKSETHNRTKPFELIYPESSTTSSTSVRLDGVYRMNLLRYLTPMKAANGRDRQPTTNPTWRIGEIPNTTSKVDLQRQLEDAIQMVPDAEPYVEVFNLTRFSNSHLCATVACSEACIPMLANDRWVIDKDFIGITPLYDGDEAKVE